MTSKNHSIAAGARQRWLPDRYARNARFVADYGAVLIDMLKPRRGERILDLGCGDGALTEKVAASGASVIGVDSSPEQVAAAAARGLDAEVVDGQALTFDDSFDAILTNAALHWMTDSEAVIAGMWRALKPGGRIVGEFGGAGNVAAVVAALSDGLNRRGIDPRAANPWYFPSPAEYRSKLEAAGFRVPTIALVPRPTPLPGEMEDWLETFGESFLNAVTDEERPDFVAEVVEALRPKLFEPQGRWVVDYVRLRFVALKPGRP